MIVKAIAVIAWLAWTQVMVSAAVEVVAWIRGRVAPSLPFSGPVQLVVRQLVLAVLIVGASNRDVSVPAAAPQSIAVAYEPLAATREATLAPAAVAAVPTGAAEPRYTVVPRDSLWRLAERHLGDGLRWRELWELNRGEPQPDGRSLVDPDLIRPGWVLRFPDDAVGLPAVTSEAAPAPLPAPPAPSAPAMQT